MWVCVGVLADDILFLTVECLMPHRMSYCFWDCFGRYLLGSLWTMYGSIPYCWNMQKEWFIFPQIFLQSSYKWVWSCLFLSLFFFRNLILAFRFSSYLSSTYILAAVEDLLFVSIKMALSFDWQHFPLAPSPFLLGFLLHFWRSRILFQTRSLIPIIF